MKNLTDLRKTVEIGADRRSASARDYSMERFKRDVKKFLIFLRFIASILKLFVILVI